MDPARPQFLSEETGESRLIVLMRWLTFALALPAIVLAHDPISTKLTWAQEISRIVYKRCVGCHRPEGKFSMSLLTYEEAARGQRRSRSRF